MEEGVKSYIQRLVLAANNLDHEEIGRIVTVIAESRKLNKTIFIVGNGGSASTASHFACDLGKGTIKKYDDLKEERFRVYSLTDNLATMTAYGNDLNYEEIFAQQLRNLAKKDDILIVITGSGNSKNILRVLDMAKKMQMISIGFLGFEGGEAAKSLDYKVIVKSNDYGIIEDLHLVLEHSICDKIRQILKGEIRKSE
jgi:D-sedoheptulose 7-phosphate isomerase